MNEADWNRCTDPQAMLALLRDRGLLTERKCRLLLCALARALWTTLVDDRSRGAVEEAEASADAGISPEALRAAGTRAGQGHEQFRWEFLEPPGAGGGKSRRHVQEAAARADASAVVAWATADEPLGFWGVTAE